MVCIPMASIVNSTPFPRLCSLRREGVRDATIKAPTPPTSVASVMLRSRMLTSKKGILNENPTAESARVRRKKLAKATSAR